VVKWSLNPRQELESDQRGGSKLSPGILLRLRLFELFDLHIDLELFRVGLQIKEESAQIFFCEDDFSPVFGRSISTFFSFTVVGIGRGE
jgi:hypothetical protein